MLSDILDSRLFQKSQRLLPWSCEFRFNPYVRLDLTHVRLYLTHMKLDLTRIMLDLTQGTLDLIT